MNEAIVVPHNPPSLNYHAVLDGKIIKSGTLGQVAPYIAQKRFEGHDVKSHADGLTAEKRQERTLRLENQVELHCFAFRLREIDAPAGVYLPGLFRTSTEAAKHRAEQLNDPQGTAYVIKDVNWRGALL